jgi:hypothetical protein
MKAQHSGFETTRDFASRMDAADPLAGYRERFFFPKVDAGNDAIYFTAIPLVSSRRPSGLMSSRS